MKQMRISLYLLRSFISALFILTFFSFECKLIAQENEDDGLKKSYDWYHVQRSYPYQTIPEGSFATAVSQGDALRGNNGVQSPNSSWYSIGPKPFAWDPSNQYINSGRVNNVIYDTRDNTGQTIYITGAQGGVFKTVDGGLTWVEKNGTTNGKLPSLSCGSLTLDAARNTLYFGTGEGLIYYGSDRVVGIFKSTDDGDTWTAINSGLPASTPIYRVVVSPLAGTNGNLLFAATFKGLYKSTNGGSNWIKIIPSDTASRTCTDVRTSPSGQYVYAVGNAPNYWVGGWPFNGIGYYRSSDQGLTFQPMAQSTGFPVYDQDPFGRSCLATSLSSEGTVYILSYNNTGNCQMYVYKSTDNGSNFVPYSNSAWLMGQNAGFNETISCSDYNADICVMGFQDLYLTTNGGANWTVIGGYLTNDNPHPDFHAIDFNPFDLNSNTICIGCDGGVSRSTNRGVSWSSLNEDLSLSMIFTVSSDPYSQSIVGGFEDFGFGFDPPSANPRTDWATAGWGYDDGTRVISSPFVTNTFVGSTNAFNYLFYATDWASFNFAGNYIGYAAPVPPMIMDPVNPNVVMTARFSGYDGNGNVSDLYFSKSVNNGAIWDGSNPFRDIHYTNQSPLHSVCPTGLAIAPSNSNSVIMTLGNVSEWWEHNGPGASRLIKSTDGGLNWYNEPTGIVPILEGGQNGFPDRFISQVIFGPTDDQEVYLTLSGYGTGHVWKSTNGGINWTDISGNLPDAPANDILVHYTNNNLKELIVATDVGVYWTYLNNIAWKVLADGLPNTAVVDLDYNRFSGQLNASCFGRGVYRLQLDGGSAPTSSVYVNDEMYISDAAKVTQQIVVGNGGKLHLGHTSLPHTFSIDFNITGNVPGIVVQDGGQIILSSNSQITLTSSSGTWGGIEIQGNSSSTLENCIFQNTTTPITINNSTTFTPSNIFINNCTFTDCGPIEINSRTNVTVSQCTWNYSNTITSDVCGVSVTGSASITVQGNSINYVASTNRKTGINVVQSSGTSVTSNIIRNTSIGIFASNSDPSIRFNNIGTTGTTNADIGIGLDNCPSAYILYDTIASYVKGISLTNGSSPVMHDNKVTGCTTDGMYCDNGSNPRLTPTIDNGVVYWDAGLNILETTTNGGDGIYISNYSTPIMAEGYNTVWGGNCYINGSGSGKWAVVDNCWVDNPPANKFCVTGFSRLTTTPYSCTPPPGAGGKSGIDGDNGEIVDPPQPLIVDLGNGVYDTLKAANSNISVNADLALYYTGTKQALQSNFTYAVNTYKQVIQNYHDSTSATESMKKIFYCYGRMHADTTAYANLRNYYLSQSSTDTSFTKTAAELSRKCLVKKLELENAIGEYENAVQNSNNHADSVSAEVNIIEVYLLMQNTGGNSRFTGRMANLKPMNAMDGLRMIKEKLYNLGGKLNNVEIPKTFSLSQNYPNPFNPTTTIKYAVPQPVKVSIKIYDILGRLVKTLINDEYKEVGFYEVKFDGSNFASGVYFYRIEAGKFVQSKKMVIVK